MGWWCAVTAAGWMDRAACAGMDVEWFFTDSLAAVAKDVCARCPVRVQCLDYASDMQPRGTGDHGVWGGTTPAERAARPGPRALSRAQAQTAHTLAARDGVAAAAARYEVTRRTLYRAWAADGLPPPVEPDRARRPARSRAWADRAVAAEAFALAEAEGLRETIRRTRISRNSLLLAWDHWGMGRPDTAAAARRRKTQAARRTRMAQTARRAS